MCVCGGVVGGYPDSPDERPSSLVNDKDLMDEERLNQDPGRVD